MALYETFVLRTSLSATCKDANHICGSHFLFLLNEYSYILTTK